MKHFYRLSVFIGAVVMLTSFSFQKSLEEIVGAMKAGNAAGLAKYFDNYVDVSLPDKSNSYSKSQAAIVMKDFFSNNPVKSFEVKHKGENAGNQFCIGVLQTKNTTFRATLFLKQKGEKQFLQEIRIEASK